MRAGYVLTDSQTPLEQTASARVEFFYLPSLERRAGPTAGGTAVNAPGAPNPVWNEVTETFALTWDEDDGMCAALMSVREQSSRNKRHDQRLALQRNGEPQYTVLELNFMKPDYSAPQPWHEHIFKHGEKVYPQLRASAPRDQNVPGEVRVRMYSSVTDTVGIRIALPYQRQAAGSYYYHADARAEPSVGYPSNDSGDVIGVDNTRDGVGEQTTSDIGDPIDSNALTVFPHTRGYGRFYAHEPTDADTQPILFGDLEYLQAAGVEYLTVWSVKDPSKKDRVPVKNQADLLYYSGHGDGDTGALKSVYGRTTPPHTVLSDIDPVSNWSDDLETFVVAGCAVLDKARHGLEWANRCLAGRGSGHLEQLLGYRDSAPLDRTGGYQIAALFSLLKSQGKSLVDAWMEGNESNNGWFAVAYTPTTYSYFEIHYQTTPHFPSSRAWFASSISRPTRRWQAFPRGFIRRCSRFRPTEAKPTSPLNSRTTSTTMSCAWLTQPPGQSPRA
jgi:hypothetical protein